MGVLDWLTKRLSANFGEGCAKAMYGSLVAARAEFPDAPEPACLGEAVAMRPSWSVEFGGPLAYKGDETGHIVDKAMSFPELVYTVITVELACRLGKSGGVQAVQALMEANEYLAKKGLDKTWSFGIDINDEMRRWAGNFTGRMFYD